MSGLSTHVLDQSLGKPAVGVRVVVFRDGAQIRVAETNADGRCTDLQGDGALTAGQYRLVFAIGAYFAREGMQAAPFFEEVAIAFVIAPGTTRCHVPLLASPFGYSTYRGS
jgi:5-hydroxyisourate hydrolase